MKIWDQGTKKKRRVTPFVDNANITVRWDYIEQHLEIVAPDNPHRHSGGGDYHKRRFDCRVQFTLDELKQILHAAPFTEPVAEVTSLTAAYEKLRDEATKVAKRLLRVAMVPEQRAKRLNAKK